MRTLEAFEKYIEKEKNLETESIKDHSKVMVVFLTVSGFCALQEAKKNLIKEYHFSSFAIGK